jgi:tRNA-uridine 2-sulfurtransferase
VFWRTKENPNKGKKVFVGLSGGVDSAVSAALLLQQGYQVTGAFIRIALAGYPCSAGEDKIAAMRVATHLRIPFVEIDLSEVYQKRVFELSMREFEAGHTPNPDALCNREIKFGLFFDWCMERGADFVATGHYAQIKDGLLYAGADAHKDQSYFLWAVPEEKLARTLFPIGHLAKPRVRALAKRFNLPNFDRPDSQGLCFLGDITIGDMLTNELTLIEGDVLSEEGEVIGRHAGAQAYTLGQRHGFTLDAQSPVTKPHYVVGKDPEFNTITVSEQKFPHDAVGTQIVLSDVNWLGDFNSNDLKCRYRYHGALIETTLDKESKSAVLHEAHYAPLGQSLVFYQQDRCIGGGTIETATLISSWPSSSPKQMELQSRSTNASS